VRSLPARCRGVGVNAFRLKRRSFYRGQYMRKRHSKWSRHHGRRLRPESYFLSLKQLPSRDPNPVAGAKAMLEDFGHTVLDAISGPAAIEIIRKTSHVHLVITDQAMPLMTGMQLAAASRVDWPTLPILLVSAYAELPSKTPFELPKLAKPFSLDDLEDAVAKTIAGNAATDKCGFDLDPVVGWHHLHLFTDVGAGRFGEGASDCGTFGPRPSVSAIMAAQF
jgi:CheY-like chemotaxis protein